MSASTACPATSIYVQGLSSLVACPSLQVTDAIGQHLTVICPCTYLCSCHLGAAQPACQSPPLTPGHPCTASLTFLPPEMQTMPVSHVMQIINAVTAKNERLDLPDAAEAAASPDGSPTEPSNVAIVSGLCALISRCWREQPAARPDFPEVISDLRTLLDLSRSAPEAQARRQHGSLHADSPQPSQRRSDNAEAWPVAEPGGVRAERWGSKLQSVSKITCDLHVHVEPACCCRGSKPPCCCSR